MDEVSVADMLLFAVLFGLAESFAQYIFARFSKDDDDGADMFEKKSNAIIDRLNEIAKQLYQLNVTLDRHNSEDEEEDE